ncbi:hypothetical protein [Nisaea sediminum]|uniref:hypothetical protein n=1 Tax=Nisaea sediminum TaxID=2775867 RepID=UPI0018682E95|nr:hypothetical protein [Nisaea sediminum]
MTADGAFDLYLGIDWSGAKGARTKGIQVAAALPGGAMPELLPNPFREHGIWSRLDVLSFLEARVEEGMRVLAGFDFAFCYPFEDEGTYFPGLEQAPERPEEVWSLVERSAEGVAELYGAAVYQRTDLPYRDYFMAPGHKGDLYRHRQRETELAAASVTTPHPVFKCIGAANVGTGSLAGMRLLHRLRGWGDRVRIWPFDAGPGGSLTVTEIFPRLFYKRASGDPRAWNSRDNLMAVCRHYGVTDGAVPQIGTEDEADALVTAAGLRALSGDGSLWAQSRQPAAAREGWIFGAAWDSKRG